MESSADTKQNESFTPKAKKSVFRNTRRAIRTRKEKERIKDKYETCVMDREWDGKIHKIIKLPDGKDSSVVLKKVGRKGNRARPIVDNDLIGEIQGCENVNDSIKDTVFSCVFCKKVFASNLGLNRHKQVHRAKDYGCDICGKMFRRKSSLQKHSVIHSDNSPYRCPICGKYSKSKERSVLHLRTHSGDKPHQCDICGRHFTQIGNLKLHKKNIHAPESVFKCEICCKEFEHNKELISHVLTHNDGRILKCYECGKMFGKKDHFEKHKELHTKLRPFSCDICGNTYKKNTDLKCHLETHDMSNGYVCDVCGHSFRYKSSLKYHLRIHTGDKPYSCDICGKAFRTSSNRSKHVLSHTNYRPFSCDQCAKSFRDNRSLVIHKRTHSGNRPYQCPICCKSFIVQSELNRHRKKFHLNAMECDSDNGRPISTKHQSTRPKGTKYNETERSLENKHDGKVLDRVQSDVTEVWNHENLKNVGAASLGVDHLQLFPKESLTIGLSGIHPVNSSHDSITTSLEERIVPQTDVVSNTVEEITNSCQYEMAVHYSSSNMYSYVRDMLLTGNEMESRGNNSASSHIILPANSLCPTNTGSNWINSLESNDNNAVIISHQTIQCQNTKFFQRGREYGTEPIMQLPNSLSSAQYCRSNVSEEMMHCDTLTQCRNINQTTQGCIVNKTTQSDTLPPCGIGNQTTQCDTLPHCGNGNQTTQSDTLPQCGIGNQTTQSDTLPQCGNGNQTTQSDTLPQGGNGNQTTQSDTLPQCGPQCGIGNQTTQRDTLPQCGIVNQTTQCSNGNQTAQCSNDNQTATCGNFNQTQCDNVNQTQCGNVILTDPFLRQIEKPFIAAHNESKSESMDNSSKLKSESTVDEPVSEIKDSAHSEETSDKGNSVLSDGCVPIQQDSRYESFSRKHHNGSPGPCVAECISDLEVLPGVPNGINANVSSFDGGESTNDGDKSSSEISVSGSERVTTHNICDDSDRATGYFEIESDFGTNYMGTGKGEVHDLQENLHVQLCQVNTESLQTLAKALQDKCHESRSVVNNAERSKKRSRKTSLKSVRKRKTGSNLKRSAAYHRDKSYSDYISPNSHKKINEKMSDAHDSEIPWETDETTAVRNNDFVLNINHKLKPKKITEFVSRTICNEQEFSQHKREQHMMTKHSAEVSNMEFRCQICNKIYPSKLSLQGHVRIHNSREHACPVCHRKFHRPAYLQRHMVIHTDKNPYRCPYCSKDFVCQNFLRPHLRTHTGNKPYQCDACGMRFTQQAQLMSHKRQHAPEKAFKCDDCGVEFSDNQELLSHITAHGREANKCKDCGKVFGRLKHLQKHMEIHNRDRRQHQCKYCDDAFLNKSDCRIHESIHTNDMVFSCEYCGKQFRHKSGLNYHIRTHTGEKPYTCKICGKSFRTNSYLHKHTMFHTGFRPYRCDQCVKGFTCKNDLIIHTRTHTGERPFTCSICEKTFKEMTTMKKHVLSIHTCSTCGKTFRERSELGLHVMSHQTTNTCTAQV